MITDDLKNAPEMLDRRQAILNAAQKLIVAEGLEGFRIREVAQRAGIHHATLLHYFPNREAIISGVIGRIVAQFGDISPPSSLHNTLPSREALHAHFQHVLTLMHTHPDNFVALQELFLRARRDDAIRQVFAHVDVRWHTYLSDLLRAGVAQGAFRADLDPQIAATLIMSAFKGLSMHADPDVAESQQVINQIERWIVGS